LPVEGRPIALWSPDQQWLATLAADFDGGYQTVNALHVWTDDGRQLETVIQIGNVRALTWMPDSIGLLAEHYADNQTGEYQLRQWDARTGAVLAHSVVDLAVYQPILSIATSADGRRLLIAVRDNSVRLYDLASAANQVPRLLTGHSGVVSDIVWSASGAYVVTSSADGVVRMWDVAAQSEVQRLQVPARQALSLSWSPDSTHLAVGTDRSTIVMYDRSLNTDVLFSAHGAEIWNTGVAHLAWSPGGDMLASSGRDHEILIRDTQAFEIIRRFEIGPVSSPLDWDAAGSRLAFANFSGWVWDADTADMFSFDCQEENVLTAVAISPDGRLAAGTGPNVFGCVWDIDRDRYVVSLNTLGVRLDWSPDGEKLAALVTDHFINETTLQIWRTSSWNVLTSIEAESDLHTIAWSPDSQYIAAGDDTGLVHIWALRSFSQSP
jgi:WD40 repeat protein